MLETIKDMLIPDTRKGVTQECTNCGAHFDEPRGTCPECGSGEVKEIGGFDSRPDT